jgi:DNA-directed RNA polymerase specialized sigma24 family protein
MTPISTNEAILDRLKPQELLTAYLTDARVDDPVYVERISQVIRTLIHKASAKREITDFEDFEEDCVLATWTKIRALKAGDATSPIDNLEAFVRQSVHNRYCDAVRRKRPKWYNLKIEVLEILTGKAGVRGFAVWENPGTSERICGFAEWDGRPKPTSSRCREILDRPDRFKRVALQNRQPSELPSHELMTLIFRYTGGPVEVDALTNCIVELTQAKGVETVSIDGINDDDSEGSSSHEWLLTSDVNVEKQVTDSGWFSHVTDWFWTEFNTLSISQKRTILLGMAGDQVAALCGSVGISRVAAGLEMDARELAILFDKLPLPDAEIAERINGSARSVPSIRFKAWAKIRRRTQRSELATEM